GILMAAAALILPAVFLLHRPLRPDEVPDWNPLVMGYTVVMLFPAAALIACNIILALISLSRTRAAMIRRLGKFIVLAASSAVCLILLDVALSLFPRIQTSFVDKSILWPEGEFNVLEPDLAYKLKPNVREEYTFEPWRFGNHVIDGQLVNPEHTGEEAVDLTLFTDSDGFCNAEVPERCDIVAVGDSYVAQSPVPREKYWSALAAKKLGLSIYNVGVSGYGPQQEAIVLKKYGLPKKPKIVVWGYFQGNDLRDAKHFDEYKKSGKDWVEFNGIEKMSFPYNRPVVRLMLFLVRALGPAPSGPRASPLPQYPEPRVLNAGGLERPISFDRWTFYSLCRSPAQIKEGTGWKETEKSLLEAKRLCDGAGARFVVVYLPAKLTVFMEEALQNFDREKIFKFARPGLRELLKKRDGTEIDADEFIGMLKENHNAQYRVLREFCAHNGIELIDTYPKLRESVESGAWPYYSYDTHINVIGEGIIAEVVASRLADNEQPSESRQ
ncbi:MAG: hypothetical protein DRP79_04470, partial [Planctomycetota bacterium]